MYIINLHNNKNLHIKLRKDKHRNRQRESEGEMRVIAKFLFFCKMPKYSAYGNCNRINFLKYKVQRKYEEYTKVFLPSSYSQQFIFYFYFIF